jgi:hypothetical protein
MALKTANNQSMTAITSLPSGVSTQSMILLATETASSSSTISFTSSIDSTYDEYVFKFYNINPSASSAEFSVGFRDGSTAYDATKTTTLFGTYNDEADTTADAGVTYATAHDLAQSTDFQKIGNDVGNQSDSCCNGTLHLFAPSSTTFVKHFISTSVSMHQQPAAISNFATGYCNTTTAIDGVQFKCSSGTFDGVIKMYGVV